MAGALGVLGAPAAASLPLRAVGQAHRLLRPGETFLLSARNLTLTLTPTLTPTPTPTFTFTQPSSYQTVNEAKAKESTLLSYFGEVKGILRGRWLERPTYDLPISPYLPHISPHLAHLSTGGSSGRPCGPSASERSPPR